jgi:hypothetical protein
MTDFPADWALKAAIIAGGPDDYEYDPDDLRIVKNPASSLQTRRLSRSILAHARLIEQTQPAPVDRKLLVAREAAARHNEALGGYEIAARRYREGLNDGALSAAVDAIILWESGYAA